MQYLYSLFFFLFFFFKCYSAFLFVCCDWVVMNQNFFLYRSMWENTKSKSFVRFWLFTFSPAFKFFTKVWNFNEKRKKKKRLVPLQICSPLHCWTTFFVCVFIPQTATRTYRSWTRVCWHSLIIYVLTCPNADITQPHVLRLFASLHSLLLLLDRDLLFVKHVHKKIPVWFVWKNSLLNMSAHYL